MTSSTVAIDVVIDNPVPGKKYLVRYNPELNVFEHIDPVPKKPKQPPIPKWMRKAKKY